LLCSQTRDHPHEDFAKFGYRPDMKVKKKIKNPFYILVATGTCCENFN
jgi:hypothetical protein